LYKGRVLCNKRNLMKIVHQISFILLVIGGLNWLATAFNFGIGEFLSPAISQIIYILVGLAAIYEVATHKNNCKECSAGSMSGPMMPR